MKILFRTVLVLLFSFGCAAVNHEGAIRTKPPANEAVRIDLTVSKKNLTLALGNEYKTSKLRAVEVFQNSTSALRHTPMFRLFDLDQGSVYDLLGLKEADIVIAINERVVAAPHVIGQIVRLLPNEKSVKFEVLRNGKSYLISTKFI